MSRPPTCQQLNGRRVQSVSCHVGLRRSDEKVLVLSGSQISRRVKAIAKAAGLSDWEFFSRHGGRVGMARCMA